MADKRYLEARSESTRDPAWVRLHDRGDESYAISTHDDELSVRVARIEETLAQIKALLEGTLTVNVNLITRSEP